METFKDINQNDTMNYEKSDSQYKDIKIQDVCLNITDVTKLKVNMEVIK